MKLNRELVALSLSFALVIFCGGCPSGSSSDTEADGEHATDGGDGESHGHSHDVPGPAGGHLLEIGDEEYHVEWVHDEDDESVIEFIVRDDMAKEEVPISAEQLTIEFTTVDDTGKESKREVPVEAVGRTDENPQTAHYELKDRIAIQNILGGSEDVTAVLKITIEGVAYEKQIEHAAHGHGHSHSH